MIEDKIMVSIVMLTYNHEKYIEQALESILMQKVNFQYEIVIGDDCSFDNTRKILRKYKKKYPEKIKLLFYKKNIGPTKNFYTVLKHTQGKYIAQLEGDDYWTDEKKLQKQVSFLEEHNEFIGTSHSCIIFNQCENKFEKSHYYYETSHEYTLNDFKKIQFPGHTCTMVYRNIFLNSNNKYTILYKADKNTGDRTINLLLVLLGKVYCMSDCMSVYRLVQKTGQTNINSQYIGKDLRFIELSYLLKLNQFAEKEYNKSILTKRYIDDGVNSAIYEYYKKRNSENKRVMESIIDLCDHNKYYYFIRMFFILVIAKIKLIMKK